MWSDLSKIPCATAFEVLYNQVVWSGEEFEWLLLTHRADLPHSWEQCYFFTQMFFVSCLQGPPWGLYRGAWLDAKGGDSLQSSGQAACPPWLFITLHSFSLGQEAALCSLLEIKGDTGRTGGKAEGDSWEQAFLRDLAPEEHVCGVLLLGSVLWSHHLVDGFLCYVSALVPIAIWKFSSNKNWKPEV